MIYLDLDGPMIDFVGGVEDYLDCFLDRRQYNLHGQLGMTRAELFSKLDGEFWSSLPKAQYADQLLELLLSKGAVTFSTAACHESPEAAWGRFEWVKRWYPEIPVIAIQDKYLLAKEGHVLVDDLETNVDAFVVEDGIGILYPTQCNRLRNVKDIMTHLEEAVDGLQ